MENSRSFLVREFDDKSIYFIVIDIIFLTLGGIRFIVSIIVDSKLIIINGWRDTFHEYRKYMMRQSSKSSEQDQRILSILSKSSIDISSSERKEIIAHVSKMKGHYYVIPTLQYYMYNLTLFMNDGKFKWIVFYLASSLFAFLSGDRITYSFFMLEVVVSSCPVENNTSGKIFYPEEYCRGDYIQQASVASNCYFGNFRRLHLQSFRLLLHQRHILSIRCKHHRRKRLHYRFPVFYDCILSCKAAQFLPFRVQDLLVLSVMLFFASLTGMRINPDTMSDFCTICRSLS